MNHNGIEDLISILYETVQDARAVPLSSEKCIIEREKVLDLLDEISNSLPGELKQAKTIVDSRSEVITNARREAETIRKQAQQEAQQLASKEQVVKLAQQQADELMRSTHDKVRELKQVTNAYVDDALRRTEDAISSALGEIRDSRSKFRGLTNPQPKKASPINEDI
ncbi:MAG: hypothetical protein IKT99_06940 [Oscillospiraceae bacterium]|nr:hypothetical protein [Oscillospiraceae bacterium]